MQRKKTVMNYFSVRKHSWDNGHVNYLDNKNL
jgi:hypothetical protein